MDTRKRLEKVLTTALGQSFEECPNAKKVVIQQTLHNQAHKVSWLYFYALPRRCTCGEGGQMQQHKYFHYRFRERLEMLMWGHYGTDRRESFERRLEPNELVYELQRYQKTFGKDFTRIG